MQTDKFDERAVSKKALIYTLKNETDGFGNCGCGNGHKMAQGQILQSDEVYHYF